MKKITLVTTNKRKLKEAKLGCELYGIKVVQAELEFDEIQSPDFIKIAKNKAMQAYNIVNEPVVVTDTAWNIPALNGFPGAYMKEVARWLEADDFLRLLSNKKDKRICFIESICYKDSNTTKLFSKEYWGKIVGPRSKTGISIEQIAEFNGHTLSEKLDNGLTSHLPQDYVWYEFAQWFSKK